ncbi:hypothetical protein ES288_A01G167300v1 [Gossypium darwinii]|uniref:Uncharacterized protein n=1 Tax=Gossypium darwinii TaxID=34276 RepID=A0A5D2HPI5_GOSDA|nr:hypothetical protein ES288_A01G167300v1 [Gossypium darwinii]
MWFKRFPIKRKQLRMFFSPWSVLSRKKTNKKDYSQWLETHKNQIGNGNEEDRPIVTLDNVMGMCNKSMI